MPDLRQSVAAYAATLLVQSNYKAAAELMLEAFETPVGADTVTVQCAEAAFAPAEVPSKPDLYAMPTAVWLRLCGVFDQGGAYMIVPEALAQLVENNAQDLASAQADKRAAVGSLQRELERLTSDWRRAKDDRDVAQGAIINTLEALGVPDEGVHVDVVESAANLKAERDLLDGQVEKLNTELDAMTQRALMPTADTSVAAFAQQSFAVPLDQWEQIRDSVIRLQDAALMEDSPWPMESGLPTPTTIIEALDRIATLLAAPKATIPPLAPEPIKGIEDFEPIEEPTFAPESGLVATPYVDQAVKMLEPNELLAQQRGEAPKPQPNLKPWTLDVSPDEAIKVARLLAQKPPLMTSDVVEQTGHPAKIVNEVRMTMGAGLGLLRKMLPQERDASLAVYLQNWNNRAELAKESAVV